MFHMCMTTKTELLQVIRKTCLRCCCGSYTAVQNCPSSASKKMYDYGTCPLYEYRLGFDPSAARAGKKPPCGYVKKSKVERGVDKEPSI